MALEDGEARFARRVSWMPGAEGAPFAEGTEVLAVRFVVMVGCEDWGIMRRDCEVLGGVLEGGGFWREGVFGCREDLGECAVRSTCHYC